MGLTLAIVPVMSNTKKMALALALVGIVLAIAIGVSVSRSTTAAAGTWICCPATGGGPCLAAAGNNPGDCPSDYVALLCEDWIPGPGGTGDCRD